eukprot:CAMPEP_0113318096 /NCGR_PEP_ID=MMETSP0010_2-20120614/12780_1 /TAXON_ID=216773 ORGANISM="Corethron hystrix, Strain 308" /NCGR_SAMPLE_ID=MMETSP0010_2 /ASSEMBLY_ACC=CAM_ASM_000155 /LENGTH=143 /DNA_ID=CAMNT_0000175287 /DNA_START=377 /DNA_END=808 /DNA_ORIENTATION=+ /assembly_acc=CAM_ASM_000155
MSSLATETQSFQIGSNAFNAPRGDSLSHELSPKSIKQKHVSSNKLPKKSSRPTSTPASTHTEFTSYGLTSDWGIYSRGVNDGLLSPRTVERLQHNIDGSTSGAVRSFLRTYENEGPMACLPYLSDPHVLPELTSAMRDSMANI